MCIKDSVLSSKLANFNQWLKIVNYHEVPLIFEDTEHQLKKKHLSSVSSV